MSNLIYDYRHEDDIYVVLFALRPSVVTPQPKNLAQAMPRLPFSILESKAGCEIVAMAWTPQQNRLYYETHREQSVERGKKWRKENPEKSKESKRRSHIAHRKQDADRSRRWKAAHREQVNASRRRRRAKNRREDKVKARVGKEKVTARARQLRRKFGLTVVEYNSILESQGGVCAICGVPPKPTRQHAVDHDHTTGRIRGVLCGICNIELGRIRDDRNWLLRAAEYLQRFGSES